MRVRATRTDIMAFADFVGEGADDGAGLGLGAVAAVEAVVVAHFDSVVLWLSGGCLVIDMVDVDE